MAMKKLIAALLACSMFVSALSLGAPNTDLVYADDIEASDTAETLYSVTYDLNGGTGTPTAIEPAPAGTVITLYSRIIKKTDHLFLGWSDGEKTYKWGAEYTIPDHDVVLTAQWQKKVTLTYDLGEVTEDYGTIEPLTSLVPGDVISLLNIAVTKEGYTQNGWYDGDVFYKTGSDYTIPDRDVTLTVAWAKYYNLIYTPGDVDGLLSSTDMIYPRLEGLNITVFGKSTFARTGYSITGWTNLATNEVYNFNQAVPMPSSDLKLEAIWKADTYNVVMNPNGGTGSKVYLKPTYDTELTIPECTFTPAEGYEFDYWMYNDKAYKPGDKFLVHVDTPNAPITFKAMWKVAGESPVVYGDIDCNGTVTPSDLISFMLHFINRDILTGDALKNADVTADGNVDLKDLATLKQFLTGDIVPGPLCDTAINN